MNNYQYLREEKTERVNLKRGRGHNVYEKSYLTQTELAREMFISQSAVDRAEKGQSIAMSTLIAYKEYFDVPYEALLGESKAFEYENVNISMELGLTDESIATIKKMKDSPVAMEMLNTFLSKDIETVMYLEGLARSIKNLYGELDFKNYIKEHRLQTQPSNLQIKLLEFQIQENLLLYLNKLDDTQIKQIQHKVEHQQVDEYISFESELHEINKGVSSEVKVTVLPIDSDESENDTIK